MSFFTKVFGGKKEPKGPTTGEAIQKLRETEEMLIKKQAFLENKIELEVGVAKKNAKKNKSAAMQALKRKKRYAKQLEQIDGTLSTIELQREALEGAHTNTAVLNAMNDAAVSLKEAHKHLDVDRLHDMMDDIAEQQDVARELSDAFSDAVAVDNDVDEDDLLTELEELERESLENNLKDGPKQLPAVPQGEIVAPRPAPPKREKVDNEVKKLEAWAS